MNYLLLHYFMDYVIFFFAYNERIYRNKLPYYIKVFYYKTTIDFMPFEQSCNQILL